MAPDKFIISIEFEAPRHEGNMVVDAFRKIVELFEGSIEIEKVQEVE